MVLVKSRFAIGAAFKLLAELLDPRFGISRRRCGVKGLVEGDALQILIGSLQEVDEIVTGVIGLPRYRNSLAPLVLGRVETNVLVLVGIVRVGARAEESEGESKPESRGAHVFHLVLSNARSEVWATISSHA